MSSLNKAKPVVHTHEGAKAYHLTSEKELERSVMSCLLWEQEFYESGQEIAERIKDLVPKCDPFFVSSLAVRARHDMKLRHVPLLLVREMARNNKFHTFVRPTVYSVIERADEITELLAIYSKDRDGSKKLNKLSNQLRLGIADAFRKFDEYQLAKYNRKKEITLKDALNICHPVPKDQNQSDLWKRLLEDKLATPDTWEVALSSGGNKKEEFERLLANRKLGGLALLRNLRNMETSGVDRSLIVGSIEEMNTSKILPFRFIAAAIHAPSLESHLEKAMLKSIANSPKLDGTTCIVVDNSASMSWRLSANSYITRSNAASGVAIILREICEDVRIISFSNEAALVPDRRGFALAGAINRATSISGTNLRKATKLANKNNYDRIVVITDEQTNTTPLPPLSGSKAYVINIASNQRGVGYGDWHHIDGWSEAVVNYITSFESKF